MVVADVLLATCLVEATEVDEEEGEAVELEAAFVVAADAAESAEVVELAGALPCGTSASEGTPAGASGASGAGVSAVSAGTGFEAFRPRCLKRVRSRCFFFFGVGGA
jgi:hypothetical protein